LFGTTFFKGCLVQPFPKVVVWYNLFQRLWDIIYTYFKNKRQHMVVITSMNDDELLDKIEEYLPVRTKEKEKFGEVFTPPVLINELLDQLPSHVWSNPNLKWLDPASGIGNFFMIVYSRLMRGLNKKIPNKIKRSQHILKNMLYMTEINTKNIKISRSIFGESNINIISADFLTHEFPHKFDIIIGNLPFNEAASDANKKNIALWPRFVFKSLDSLKEDGFLVFIHPPNWRSPDNKLKIWDILTHKHIIYLHIYGAAATKELFHVNTKVDLYVVQNSPSNKNKSMTIVIDELGEKHNIKLQELDFLPNYKIKEITKLLYNPHSKPLTIIYGSTYSTAHTKETKNNNFKYPVISSITNGDTLHLRYTDSNKKGHFNIPKVIINGGRYPYPFNDYAGKYAMTQNLFAIPITSKTQGDAIVKAINSEEFNTILQATKWSTFAIDYKLFTHFKSDFYKPFLKTRNLTRNLTRKLKIK